MDLDPGFEMQWAGGPEAYHEGGEKQGIETPGVGPKHRDANKIDKIRREPSPEKNNIKIKPWGFNSSSPRGPAQAGSFEGNGKELQRFQR